MTLKVSISLNGISSCLNMSRYMDISMRMSFNPSESRKIRANMIANISEREY